MDRGNMPQETSVNENKSPSPPRWVVFTLLDGLVVLFDEPPGVPTQHLRVPRVRKGQIEVAFMERIDVKWHRLESNGCVHAYYLRYIEIHPPTFEGAKIH